MDSTFASAVWNVVLSCGPVCVFLGLLYVFIYGCCRCVFVLSLWLCMCCMFACSCCMIRSCRLMVALWFFFCVCSVRRKNPSEKIKIKRNIWKTHSEHQQHVLIIWRRILKCFRKWKETKRKEAKTITHKQTRFSIKDENTRKGEKTTHISFAFHLQSRSATRDNHSRLLQAETERELSVCAIISSLGKTEESILKIVFTREGERTAAYLRNNRRQFSSISFWTNLFGNLFGFLFLTDDLFSI